MNKSSAFIKILRVIITFWLFVIPHTLFSQLKIYHIDNVNAVSGKSGTFFSLPMTCLKIDIDLTEIHRYRGPYSDFAFQYLGIENVVTSNQTEFEISRMRITAFSEPDPEALYFVEYGEKQSKEERSVLVDLTSNGLLRQFSYNMPASEDEKVMKKEQEILQEDSKSISDSNVFKYFTTPNKVEKIDTIIKRMTIDTTTIEDISLNRNVVTKTLEQRALEAASQVERIRNFRFNLLSGYQEVNYDRKTLEYMDNRLAEMEEQYISLFKGAIIEKPIMISIVYIPAPEKNSEADVVCRFQKEKGIRPASETSADPVSIHVKSLDGSQPEWDAGTLSLNGIDGVFYRIPVQTRVMVMYKDRTLFTGEFEISQLGRTGYIPVNEKFRIQYYPESGSIKSVEVR
ncbi:MAG: DUF4831 family protein [Bacteroidetes bacterium]|nr:DUF4831 family protein [Bacteroidota bacterium]